MIRLADYVFRTLADRGCRQVFLVTGGGAMHLNDALGRENRLAYVCHHHEQAATMAAEGYARVTGQLGVASVTTGPGAINALNGVFGAWTDSIPLLVISGQVKREMLMATHGLIGRLRQLGDQEVDIVSMVRGITKYAVTVIDPVTIRYHLERALHLATHGRPGPCWLDVPVDVQAAMIDPAALRAYDPAEDAPAPAAGSLAETCATVLDRLASAERPVILAGSGVRLAAGALETFGHVHGRLGIPVATAWTHDLIASDDPLFCGRPGSIGDRAGNFCVQNSDCVLVLGSRLNVRQVSYNWDFFARHAYKIQVDVDPAELDKPTVRPDLPITADAGDFLRALEDAMDARGWPAAGAGGLPRHANWRDWCRTRRERYPVFLPGKHLSCDGAINPYDFARVLFEELADDDVLVCGDATACIVFFQSAVLRGTQRLFSNSGSASMGWDLPAAIGAACARAGGRVICLAGDGSLQMNIQELQTLAHHRWPIKLFVLNNNGYLSIRQTQTNFFGLAVGAGPQSGVSFPDYARVAAAYGLPARRLDQGNFRAALRATLDSAGPEVCEVMLDGEQGFEPKLTSRRLPDGRMVSSPLEDMAPFLPREEFRANMLVPVLE